MPWEPSGPLSQRQQERSHTPRARHEGATHARGPDARATARFEMAGTAESRLLRSLRTLDSDVKNFEDRIQDATSAIDSAVAEGDRLGAQKLEVELELSALSTRDPSASVAALRERAEELERKLTGQRDVNMDLLQEICQLEDTHSEAMQRVVEINAQVNEVNNEIEECREQAAAARERAAIAGIEVQESLADRHRRLAEIDSQIDALRRQAHEQTHKRAALADLRERNNKMQVVVDLVKDTLSSEPPFEARKAIDAAAAREHAAHQGEQPLGDVTTDSNTPVHTPRKQKVHFQ
eukprot:m.197124 g.197124  ORF g.197124 m.197124 type:complete len:294 (-) comp20009_c0_seq1:50-931(-)